jgi:hypothetical protein
LSDGKPGKAAGIVTRAGKHSFSPGAVRRADVSADPMDNI